MRGKRWSGYLSWRRKRRFVHRLEILEQLTEAVCAERPVQILVTGDLVHVGLPREIRAATAWLEELGGPESVMLVPGNHDVYAADSWPAVAESWSAYMAGDMAGDPAGDPAGNPGLFAASGFPAVRELGAPSERVRLIGLSSAGPSPLFMAHGRVGESQLLRLDEALCATDLFRCVLIHHPPLPGMTAWRKGLLDASGLERVLQRHGAELVLHGHVHRNVERHEAGGVPVFGTASASSCGPSACYRVFDLTREGEGWRVAMRLVQIAADGRRTELSARNWWSSLSPRASGAAASR